MNRSVRPGKGKRNRPWRDGGASKKGQGNWKNHVPNSIEEYEIEDPIVHIAFEFYELTPFDSLKEVDNSIFEAGIPYSIKSRGKTGFAGITRFSKYVITCSKESSELISSFVIKAGGNVQST
jgi:hypothetical protein